MRRSVFILALVIAGFVLFVDHVRDNRRTSDAAIAEQSIPESLR